MANDKGVFKLATKRGIKLGAPGVQLVGDTADPTDNGLADGRLSYLTGTGARIRVGGTFYTLLLDNPASDGLQATRIARATYDFAVDGGAISTIGLGVTIPDNAIITRAWYEVITTLTSATDAATIALSIPTDDVAGIVAAIAISDASNVWDAGIFEAIQTGTVANFSTKTTAARELSAVIAVEAVTAGKFILFAEYVVSD